MKKKKTGGHVWASAEDHLITFQIVLVQKHDLPGSIHDTRMELPFPRK